MEGKVPTERASSLSSPESPLCLPGVALSLALSLSLSLSSQHPSHAENFIKAGNCTAGQETGGNFLLLTTLLGLTD